MGLRCLYSVLVFISLFFSHRDPDMVKWIGTRKLDI